MLFSQLIRHHTQIKRLEGRPANNNPLSVGQQVHHRRRDWIQNFHAILSILTEGLSFSSQRIELPTMALHYLPNKTVTRGPSVTSRVTGCPVQSGGLVRRLRNLGHARELRSSCLVSYFGPSWKGFTLLPCAMCTRLSAFSSSATLLLRARGCRYECERILSAVGRRFSRVRCRLLTVRYDFACSKRSMSGGSFLFVLIATCMRFGSLG